MVTRLYKYYDEGRYEFFKNGLIRYTQPQAFNDPFEMKPHFSTLASKQFIAELINKEYEGVIRKEYNNLPDEIRHTISYREFQRLMESKKGWIKSQMEKCSDQLAPRAKKTLHDGFEKHVGVLSLTEVPDNLLMWSHYANSHQGFIVEFDADHEFFDQRKSDKDDFRCLRRVSYSKSRSTPAFLDIVSLDDLLSKGDVWSYEREWRMLVALEDSDCRIESKPHDIHLFKTDFSAVKSVRIGVRASEETKHNIIMNINDNSELTELPVFQMELDEKHYKVNTVRIK